MKTKKDPVDALKISAESKKILKEIRTEMFKAVEDLEKENEQLKTSLKFLREKSDKDVLRLIAWALGKSVAEVNRMKVNKLRECWRLRDLPDLNIVSIDPVTKKSFTLIKLSN
jgi:hypothetical protein